MSTDESMLDVYIYETQQLLQSLDDILLDGEGVERLTEDQINEVFRVMHTIKGASSMMEFDEIAEMAHATEDIFAQIRELGASDSQWPSVFNLVFRVVSFFNSELEKIQSAGKPDGVDVALMNSLHEQLAGMKSSQQSTAMPELPAERAAAPAPAVNPYAPHYKIRVLFEENCQMEAIRALGVRESLKEICPYIATVPKDLDAADTAAVIKADGFLLYVQSDENPDEIRHRLEATLFMKKYSVVPIDGSDE